jgi:hypothetical protein
MATGQGTVLVVSIYVTLEFVTFIFTYVAHVVLNFAITDVNFDKKITICTILYVLLNDINKYVLLERSLHFPSTNSQSAEFSFNNHTSIIYHQKVATSCQF